MRLSDRREVWRSSHATPLDALTRSLEHQGEKWTALVDGRPIGMFGIAQASPVSDIGVPWCLTTLEADEHRIAWGRRSYLDVQRWKERYSVQINYVDIDNEKAIQWLTWLGYTLCDPRPHGKEGTLFYPFYMENDNV
jgi:hypothetical protein